MDYNFEYEFRKYADSLRKPLRTYRVEFNLGGPTTTTSTPDEALSSDVYITSFSTTKISTTPLNIQIDPDSYAKDNNLGTNGTANVHSSAQKSEESVHFSEIRSHKRITVLTEDAPDNEILNTPGIIDYRTGKTLTVAEAIKMHILDVRTGEILVSDSGERLRLEEAVTRNYMDMQLAHNLLRPDAVADQSGTTMSLLQVIQKELSEAETYKDSKEGRVKVIATSKPLPSSRTPKCIADAIEEGVIDQRSGMYRTEGGALITISEAFARGFLIHYETVKIKANALCLHDALAHGLVDTSGWITDRNTGDKFRLDSAIAGGLINPSVREVVDAKNDNKVTVSQALELGILNAKTGRYMNHLTKEKLTFAEAKNRQLICKPMTLKDVCDLSLFDQNGKVLSPVHRSRLAISEAIQLGILDGDSVRSVARRKGELVTLNEALQSGIIVNNSYTCDGNGETISIPEAVDRGLISSVSQRSIFNIDGFKDPYTGEFVSLNTALAKNVVRKKSGQFMLDAGKGSLVSLPEAVELGLVRPEVFEMLSRKVGVFEGGRKGNELSVLDLVLYDWIDPKSGFLLDPQTRSIIPLDDAIRDNVITADGALLLSSLLNITLTTETVTKTIKRYVTVTEKEDSVAAAVHFNEAVQQGLIDETNQLFTDPKSGQVYSIQQALNHKLLLPDEVESHSRAASTVQVRPKISTLTIVKKSFLGEGDEEPPVQTKVTEKRESYAFELVDDPQQKNTLMELPSEGWSIEEAIRKGALDPITGMFVVPGTDRLVSFEECINLRILDPESADVVDCSNGRRVSVPRALEKRVLSPIGSYEDEGNTYTLRTAIDKRLVILRGDKVTDLDVPDKILHVSKLSRSLDLTDRMQSEYVETGPSSQLGSPEPIQIAPGVIYDPSTALVIFTETGQSENIVAAVNSNKVDGSCVSFVDKASGTVVNIREAIDRQLIDPETGACKGDKGATSMSLIDAVKRGALVVVGAPLVAAAGAINCLQMILDPKTGKQIPLELAIERGFIKANDNLEEGRDSSRHASCIIKVVQTVQPKAPINLGDAVAQGVVSPKELSRMLIHAEGGGSRRLQPVLQKMRKKVCKIEEGLKKKLIDKDTAEGLAKCAASKLAVSKGLETGLISEKKGFIVDPLKGTKLSVRKAIDRGVLEDDQPDQLLLPLYKPQSIPQLANQGLVDPETSKIIHPETGDLLSLSEAVVCDILDPDSLVKVANGKKVRVEDAIKDGFIDDSTSVVRTKKGDFKIIDALQKKAFEEKDTNKPVENIPPVGLTFPVAVDRKLIDQYKKTFTHPITKKSVSVESAIKNDQIMAIPVPPRADSISIKEALDQLAIDTEKQTFTCPKSGEVMAIREAVDWGKLVVKPMSEFVPTLASVPITSITETVTSHHTVTTKVIEVMSGYAMLDSGTVQDIQTGETYSMDQAKERGIIMGEEESQEKFTTRGMTIKFNDAIQRGLINIITGTFTDPFTDTVMPIAQAVQDGLLETTTTEIVQPTIDKVEKLDIMEAVQTIYDEKTESFVDPKDPSRSLTLIEAMDEGIIDSKSVIYDVKNNRADTLEDSIKNGLIDPKSGLVNSKSGVGMQIKEAAKLGLMAVVGAPILAGMAVVDAVTKVVKAKEPSLPNEDHEAKGPPTTLAHDNRDKLSTGKVNTSTVTKVETTTSTTTTHKTSVSPDKDSNVIEGQEIFEVIPLELRSLPVQVAVDSVKIEPEVNNGIENDQQLAATVPEATESEQTPDDMVEVLSQDMIHRMEQELAESHGELVLTEKLTSQDLEAMRMFNTKENVFLDPNTGSSVSFQVLMYELGVIDPDRVFVKDINANVYQPLTVALDLLMIDRHTGHMVDPKTGQRVNFFECLRRKWIVHRLEDIPEESDQMLTLDMALKMYRYDLVGNVFVKDNGETISFVDALDSGLIDISTVSVYDPSTSWFVSMPYAISKGVVDLKKGVLRNLRNKEELPLGLAYQKKYLLPGIRTPVALEAVVKSNLYDAATNRILDTSANQFISLGMAIEQGIVEPVITLLRDSKQNVTVPLVKGQQDRDLINGDESLLRHSMTKEWLPMDKATQQGLIETKKVKFDLIELIIRNYYNPMTGLVLNPATGESITIADGISDGSIDISKVLVRGVHSDIIYVAAEAIRLNLLDVERGVLLEPTLTLTDALERGYLLSSIEPISLPDALIRGLYDPSTGKFDIIGKSATLESAIAAHLITPDDLIVQNQKSKEIISLADAIQLNIINPKTGFAVDHATGQKITLLEALEYGIIILPQRKFSLPDAVYKGLYDPRSGTFSSTTTTEKLPTDRAIHRGIVDPQSTILNINGRVIPFELAVENGIVDPKRGVVVDEFGNRFDFREAFDMGMLIEARTPMGLSEAMAKNLFDEGRGMIMDPKTGKYYTLAEALRLGLISNDVMQFKDKRSGLFKTLTLLEAIEKGIIDDKTATVLSELGYISLVRAFEMDVITDSKAPISIQRAIHQGLYEEATGKLVDTQTGRKITLLEGVRKFFINPYLPLHYDELDEVVYSLNDCCRSGIVDRREGVFRELDGDQFVPFNKAMASGQIIDIENGNFGLYEALAMGFYDPNSKMIVNPVNNRLVHLDEACEQDLINPIMSMVKNINTNKYETLKSAIESRLVDPVGGFYRVSQDEEVDLEEARRRGLIVPFKKPISLERAIKCGLYKSESGKIVDPSTNQLHDLTSAIHLGLINPDTTVFRDANTGELSPLESAVEMGNLDVLRGRAFDTKQKVAYNYDLAFEKKLLVSVRNPTGIQRKEMCDLSAAPPSPQGPRELSLEDAISYGLINPDTAVTKDAQTGAFKQLSVLIANECVDTKQKAMFDPKSLFFAFETFTVFLNEPISFDRAIELNLLDLETGKFTDPSNKNNVMSLREALTLGYIDPDTALIKDGIKKKLIRLPEAYRKGLIDGDKANVFDHTDSKVYSLAAALDSGLVVTPKRAFTLIESLVFGVYQPETGSFRDPFSSQLAPHEQNMSLADVIAAGLVDPSSTIVRTEEEVVPLIGAIASGLIDPVSGQMSLPEEKQSVNLLKAYERGFILPAEQRQAVFEKFSHCEENLSSLMKWIATVEMKIASTGGQKEHVDDIRNQINSLKQIKDEIDSNSRPVAACLEQVRQITLTGGEVLSAPEITGLENSARELKSRVDRAQDRSNKLLKKLTTARDELTKLRSELDVFSGWLESARRTLEDKERALSDLKRLSAQAESTREFVSDVIAHQADLRFIGMAAQKFMDENKEYLDALNDFRTTLPDRLPHIEQISSSESPIKKEVSLVSAQYRDLLNRVNALSDKLSGLGGRQREYQDALDKAQSWLKEVQPRVKHVLSDAVGTDPHAVQDQMNDAKALHNEFIAQGRLIDNVQQALDGLLKSLAGQLSPSEVRNLETPVNELKDRYNQYLTALGDRCKMLDKTLVQSQGVQDALDGIVSWINQSEDQFKLNLRPASLIKERLQEQVRDHRTLMAELESHRASIESVRLSANELIQTASNAGVAKKIQGKLQDTINRYEKLMDKGIKRGEFLDETLAQLIKFNDECTSLEQELGNLQELLESRELNSLPPEDLNRKMMEISRIKDQLRPMYDDCVRNGKELVSKRDVTDVGIVRDRVKALENQWKSLDTSLLEKSKLSKQKAEQFNAYESLKDQVLHWLSSIETRVTNFAPVSVDTEIIKSQIEELRPLVKEHKDYASTIDKVNDLGTQYDLLIRPDSPSRKRSGYSPVKRVTVSPLRSPSPTKSFMPGQSPLSPSGSSGFGSRRTSQEGFQLSEVTPIQQQLTEINNRYSLVGIRLNDRQNELDTLRDEMKKHQENIKVINQFLEKIQRQVPKESIGSKDEAEKCNRQARKILEEMYEKQSLLDSTKAQVKDLLRRKPDAKGADRLKADLDDVVDKWKGLNDLLKDRINISEQLKDFLDTHDSLNSWLNAKERMFTVLGPISSDPRMVQSQVQQVQVLREEFRGQQPQLNHLQDVGSALLQHFRPSTSEAQAVDSKLSAIKNKWDDLMGRLDERAQSLGAAADSSKEFDAGLNRLREALQKISDDLDGLPMDKDRQETLKKIENLERQLEGQRPLLADAEAAAANLCNVLSDPASRADVNARVAGVNKQYQALQKKLDNRKAETDAALREGRQFAENCARTLGWLSDELNAFGERLQVSAHKPTLQHQIDTHEPIYREIMTREHEIIMLLNKGRDLQEKSDRSVQRDLEKIGQQWERLRKEVVDRQSRLQTCMEHCKKYNNASEHFLTWLRGAEEQMNNLKPGVLKKSQLDQQLRELQTLRTEVWKRSGEYETMRNLGDTFLSACDIDKEPVKAELQDIKERWEKLNNDLLAKAQAFDACSRRLGDFNDELRNLNHAVGRCEDRLGAHDALGGASRDPKMLDRVKAIRDDALALNKPLNALQKLVGDIGAEMRENGGTADHLKSDVDTIGDRIEDLQNRLNDRCGELQSAAVASLQFNEQVKGFSHDLSDLEVEIGSLSPPGREIKVVQKQIENDEELMNKINVLSERIEDIEQVGERLVDSGFSPDAVQTREQVATLKRNLLRNENKVRDHEEDLQKALADLKNFYNFYDNVMEDLKDVEGQIKQLKPVSSELDQIRHQQEDARLFRQKVIEPLADHIVEGVRNGQDLVRSALNGVSTAVLEKDLEKLNEKWNNIKDKVNERDRRLDVGLLQSGKFQEALDGLAKWLSDTEEMVANQKPPSADYKVVKAQLQEQKFLKKMLLDRQNSMSSLFNLGKEVAAGCEPSEKAAIERQLKELMNRFDALTDGAEKRTLDLERAMQVAKRFQDKLIPLTHWLEGAEKEVKAMELVPTDEEKIQQRVIEHEALHDDILSKKPDFSELADIAGELMELVGDDEGVGLTDKIHGITERYTNLVDASENVGQLLADSRQGLRHLVLTYQELVAWMDSMDAKLAKFRVIPVHTEKLLEQMDMLVELNEDIANRAPNVESTVETGSELMKHISSDEALQLKDKLDSLQRRYGDLATKGGNYLKNIQEALPLVQQFHNAHGRLVEWMESAESILAAGDPKEMEIIRLEGELSQMRPVLEAVNLVGPQLCQLSPGEGAATIESLVMRDNRRFDGISEQIQRKAERLNLSKQRSKEVTGDIDELLEWFREMDATLRDADAPAMEPKLVRAQLQEHRAINDDISSQKGRVRDVTASAKKVLRESQPNENTLALKEKLEDLKEVVDTVVQLCSERLSILEQALPLSEHFADSHNGLVSWLDDMEHKISMLSMPALRPDQIALQQDKNERLLQSISEHKPLLDKLNKTGETLAAIVADDDSHKIHDILESDNARYNALKVELRERQQALEQALQESSQFSDKLEGMLRALANTADQVNNAEPISAHPPKIEDQIDENAGIIEDLDKRNDAYKAVQKAANDVISKASNPSDPAVKDIKKKLEKLNNLWDDVQKATSKRGASLDDTLKAAKLFWDQLNAVMDTLHDLQETLNSQEPPAAQPQAIQKQQLALQDIRHEIDQTKPEVEKVRRTGNNLMQLCGEPDKPEVKKHIEDLDHAWDNITALYAKREENLIDAMEKAMEFHETMQNLLKFLDRAEDKFGKLGPVGSDIDAVKRQIDQLRHFKDEVDPHMVEVESLNRQAIELTERTSPDQAQAIKEPLVAVNRRWESLLRGMVDRQKQLEHALLHLGQFQHALNELLVWISRTDNTLDQLKPVPGDPQLLEVELAKLKVLANDIQAHQNSVDTLNDAGRQLIETDRGSAEASSTQEKLRQLNNQWKNLIEKSADRQHELEEALREANSYIGEVQDLLGWLGDVDGLIGASKPVGGLPETASEQLERFMEIYTELEENRPKVETLLAQGQEYIKKQNQMKVSSSNLQHILRTLKQRWDAVLARASDKKIKLEIALKEATEFNEALQAFIEWLTKAEKQLSGAAPVSRVLETIQTQIEEHKELQKDVSSHREVMLLLDKKGTHLKYFSQKQDVILIKNLLVSVQHRWERVVAKSAERTRALDHGYKEAREFHDAWLSLMNWLAESEASLDQITEMASHSNDPAQIKKHLEKVKETQRNLSARQGQYDTTMRSGKNLTDRAPKSDEPVLMKMMVELKESWTRLCSKSVDRQRKLEEALLLSGQFSEALQALLEWLRKAKNKLSEDGPVHGDLDTVTGLVDRHNHLKSDLEKRAPQMHSVLKTGRELEKNAGSKDVGKNLNELQQLWDDVHDLMGHRGQRLEDALRDAERLHKGVHMLLEWLSQAEQKLRFAATVPEDEFHASELLKEHAAFMRELKEKEHDKDETLRLANAILNRAHPDAIPIIKNWITIIQSRWDEVSQWSINRENKLKSHLQTMKDLDDSIEELLKWLLGLESTLLNLQNEELPEDIAALDVLIQDHNEFMENTARRQAEVDRACKPKPPATKEVRKPSRGVIKPPVRGSSHDLRETSPDYPGRRQSRISPGREQTPDRDRLPHYGPRFAPSNATDMEFRSPRANLLWDKWRYVWMLSWERQRRLHDHRLYLQDLERVRQFSWDDWRKRFLKFMNHKKSRLTDLFRKMDKDNNGLIPRDIFVDGIINTKFDTTRMEMGAVADLFDKNGEGLIDWQEFIAALRPDWQDRKPANDSEKIHDEVKRLVMLCTCRQKFRVFQVGEGKYRFGDSQKLRLVRILRSTVMVRVGGGWCALDEFLVKNDPCRAKGRTNIELREQFILADGVSQSMAAFKPRMSPSSHHGSPSPVPMSSQGPIMKVREKSQRSVAMSRPSRSSLSVSTPDSLSDNESSHGIGGRYTQRKPSVPTRTGLTPGGSLSNSKPNSRPLSRAGSKPPSRQGSTLSLDSTDDGSQSRIPTRRVITSTPTSTARPSRLSVGGKAANGTPRTPSGAASPAPARNGGGGGMSRSSSIPTLAGGPSQTRSRIPVRNHANDCSQPSSISSSIPESPSGRTASGTSTPSGMQTPRKGSVEPTATASLQRKARGSTPGDTREPFKL